MATNLTIEQMKTNREAMQGLFDTFIEILKPLVIDFDHLNTLEDAMYGMLGRYDAEICYHINWMQRFEEMAQYKLEQYRRAARQ